MEKEFKKIAQEAERKYEDVRTNYAVMSKKYNDVMQKLSKFASENENLTKENEDLKAFFSEITNYERIQVTRVNKKGTKSMDKTKTGHHYNPSGYIKLNCTSKKVR